MDPADPTDSGQTQTCNCCFLMETRIEQLVIGSITWVAEGSGLSVSISCICHTSLLVPMPYVLSLFSAVSNELSLCF